MMDAEERGQAGPVRAILHDWGALTSNSPLAGVIPTAEAGVGPGGQPQQGEWQMAWIREGG